MKTDVCGNMGVLDWDDVRRGCSADHHRLETTEKPGTTWNDVVKIVREKVVQHVSRRHPGRVQVRVRCFRTWCTLGYTKRHDRVTGGMAVRVQCGCKHGRSTAALDTDGRRGSRRTTAAPPRAYACIVASQQMASTPYLPRPRCPRYRTCCASVAEAPRGPVANNAARGG